MGDRPSGRLGRWVIRLSEFNYDISFKKGQYMFIADALSRNSLPISEAMNNQSSTPETAGREHEMLMIEHNTSYDADGDFRGHYEVMYNFSQDAREGASPSKKGGSKAPNPNPTTSKSSVPTSAPSLVTKTGAPEGAEVTRYGGPPPKGGRGDERPSKVAKSTPEPNTITPETTPLWEPRSPRRPVYGDHTDSGSCEASRGTQGGGGHAFSSSFGGAGRAARCIAGGVHCAALAECIAG